LKIAHESPKSIFDAVEEVTDYSYALVHLFEEDNEYYDQFLNKRREGREIILDNSVFELGEGFDAERFHYWVDKLQPTWHIIPDVPGDCNRTINNVEEWVRKYGSDGTIGVVHGKSYEEIVRCYNAIEPLVSKVAISFNYPFFRDGREHLPTTYHMFMEGRREMIARLDREQVINADKPHHLLGCGLPQEFSHYGDYSWIDSVDTSNPVVAGIKGIVYSPEGMETKPEEKLFTLINATLGEDQVKDVMFNIRKFREFINGRQ